MENRFWTRYIEEPIKKKNIQNDIRHIAFKNAFTTRVGLIRLRVHCFSSNEMVELCK